MGPLPFDRMSLFLLLHAQMEACTRAPLQEMVLLRLRLYLEYLGPGLGDVDLVSAACVVDAATPVLGAAEPALVGLACEVLGALVDACFAGTFSDGQPRAALLRSSLGRVAEQLVESVERHLAAGTLQEGGVKASRQYQLLAKIVRGCPAPVQR